MASVSGQPLAETTAVTTTPGSEIELQLAAAPTTGYVWEPRIIPPGRVIVGRSHTPAAPSTIGGTGTDSFRVRVTAAGTYDLVFVLKRPWEAQPVRTHTSTSPPAVTGTVCRHLLILAGAAQLIIRATPTSSP